MTRKQAIRIIAANEYEKLSEEDRKLIIFSAWGLDEGDEIFHLLPLSLKEELLKFEEPQTDIRSSQYDMLVKMICESSYSEYPNERLSEMAGDILKTPIIVEGKNPEKFACPCCGKKTLSVRGEYDICPKCGWEDDGTEVVDKYSIPNHMTLKQGIENYLLYGKCVENIENS